MSRAGFALVRAAGTPFEIGLRVGRAVADLVAHNLEAYFRRFADEVQLDWPEVLHRAGLCWQAVRDQSPEFAAMVEGIAEGAGQPVLDLAALNLRYELLYAEYSRHGQLELGSAPMPAGECTAFAVLPETSEGGHLWLGQNWDWIPQVAGVLVHVTRPDGMRILCFTEAGVAGGKIGLNSAGVGLVINGLLSHQDDWSRQGRPFHVRAWEVLCSRTLEDAVTAATRGRRACSANFLIGQATGPGAGTAVDVETAPEGVCTYDPTRGVLAHANHFLDPDRLGIWQPIVEEKRSTYHRCDRMERLLHQAVARGPVDEAALRQILRDHDGQPDSICRHPNPALPAAERYQTVASLLMDLHAGRMLAAAGPPCEHEHREYAV